MLHILQMIICGESRNHNIKIAEYLRANGMWSEENTILFTEDLLNMKRSLVSIYALADDNTQNWYALPERKESFRGGQPERRICMISIGNIFKNQSGRV